LKIYPETISSSARRRCFTERKGGVCAVSDLFAGGSYRWQAEVEELRELIYAGRMPVIKENAENITVSDAVKEVFAIPAGAYGSLCLSGSVSADGSCC